MLTHVRNPNAPIRTNKAIYIMRQAYLRSSGASGMAARRLIPLDKANVGRSLGSCFWRRCFAQVPSYNSTTALSGDRVGHVHQRPQRIVIGITGATGAPYAIRILSLLRALQVETHLIISKWALATLKYETTLSEHDIRSLASVNYVSKDLSAPISSGSFQHDGMMIVPCSMKTLAAVRSGLCDDLISRAADVSLKEGRKLLLAVRETPLSDIHLDNMLTLRRAGAVIFPPVPAFYTRPKDLEDLVNQSAGRMLDMMGIHTNGFERWEGFRKDKHETHTTDGLVQATAEGQ